MNINHSGGELNRNEQVNQIIYFIKNKNDYANAAKVMISSNFSIQALKEKTIKLSQFELAKLADSIIESKKK
ncbi:hypothetical protein CRV08_02905 [Halarcobacter ebronensis]|uniref:Uncharacterized protein n=1 Tax=Halarcobacter ebronensis TaxID=1462615 RepID=A0A4Q1AYN5_9BACT|nr:hypothetical protein [Halarcobacter ebronensis]QKF82819.1 hypothetical protein AEBR_2351 [Halarcobacter ebronensis]RXJ69669.1 hypothetical protein CRV08_02905 [Halarcobacter ebronensis]RXK06841.1 hypothetical protein CRV07_05265 [Halarcobacter ebronensis]